MLRNFLKNRKAQITAEYALMIALVVAAAMATQTFVERGLNAGVHDAVINMRQQTNAIGNTTQYEPSYLQSKYDQSSNSVSNVRTGAGLQGQDQSTNSMTNGSQSETYNSSDMTSTQ